MALSGCSFTFADDEFQPRPDVTDSANFDIYKPKGQRDFSYSIFANIGFNL